MGRTLGVNVTEDELKSEIVKLERLAAPLDPDSNMRRRLLSIVSGHAEKFLSDIDSTPTYVAPSDDIRGLSQSNIPEKPQEIEHVLSIIERHVDRSGVSPTSPKFMGYVPGGGLYHAALGDYLAAVSNRFAGLSFISPGAARLENAVIRWMAEAVGLPPTSHGTLTSGGSIATLISIVAARDALSIFPENANKAVLYATKHTHHCIFKALHVAGLKGVQQRMVSIDACCRMQPESLKSAVEADKREGFKPWLVVGTAGTVTTGSVDPLDDLASICRDHNIWFHVDGAYGGLFALSPEGKKILSGIDRADTVVLDPHKALFLPYGTGAVLARDRNHLLKPFSSKASYIQDFLDEGGETSSADLSIELTRHFRGMRLWLPLQLAGVSAFRAALSEKILLARYFHYRISKVPHFEVGPAPDLSIVTFRYLPAGADSNQVNGRLLRTLQRGGHVFLSGADLDGRSFLRCAIMSFRTHLKDISTAIETISDAARNVHLN